MKKLIMLGVAICAACVVQAASFQWNASSVNGVDGGGNVLTSSGDAATFVLAYLGTSDSYSYDSAVVVQTGSWSITSSKKSGNTAKVGGNYDGTGSANGGSFANGQVYAVMVQTDDGLKQIDGVSPYTVSGYSGDTWSGTDYTFASSNYVADKASYAGGGGGDVPEPTSGLLLLVGGAMLALRRKQK